jgi:hypothetical protein
MARVFFGYHRSHILVSLSLLRWEDDVGSHGLDPVLAIGASPRQGAPVVGARDDGRGATGTSLNKAIFFCKLAATGLGMNPIHSTHGDLEFDGSSATGGGVVSQRQRSYKATPGSASTAVMLLLPSLTVERRPLPPLSSATVSSGRRLQG